jgi:hypothetical protein
VNTLGKMMALDALFGLGMFVLSKYAPQQKQAITTAIEETAQTLAPELTQQLAELKAGE